MRSGHRPGEGRSWSRSAQELQAAGNVPAQHREQVMHTAWGHTAALGSKTWLQELCAIPNLPRHCRKTLSGSHMSVDTPLTERSQGTSREKGFGVQLPFWHKTPHFIKEEIPAHQCMAATPRVSHVPRVELTAAPRARKLKFGGCRESQKA